MGTVRLAVEVSSGKSTCPGPGACLQAQAGLKPCCAETRMHAQFASAAGSHSLARPWSKYSTGGQACVASMRIFVGMFVSLSHSVLAALVLLLARLLSPCLPGQCLPGHIWVAECLHRSGLKHSEGGPHSRRQCSGLISIAGSSAHAKKHPRPESDSRALDRKAAKRQKPSAPEDGELSGNVS